MLPKSGSGMVASVSGKGEKMGAATRVPAALDRSTTPGEDEERPVCEKPFAPETARGNDEDEACKDGQG